MWGILGNLLVGLAASVIFAVLSYRKPVDTIDEAGEVEVPKAEEGDEIGKVFGTVLVKDPQVVWYGDQSATAIVQRGRRRYGLFGPREKTTVGYKYYLGIHFVLSLGPVDRLLEITVNKARAWRGQLSGTSTTAGDGIYINRPEMFGGEKREGGIAGPVDFAPGYPTQTSNSYLAGVLGAIPSFRGVASAVLRRVYIGTSNYPKPWAFRVQRVFVGDQGAPQWYPEKAGISRGAAFNNAAIYIAFDASGSMAIADRFTAQIQALQGLLASIRDNNDPDSPNDLRLVRFAEGVGSSVTYTEMGAGSYDAAIAWLGAQGGPAGATNYEAGVSLAPSFYAVDPYAGMTFFDFNLLSLVRIVEAGVTYTDKRKVVIFITDGLPTDGNLANAAATLQSIPGVEVYAFNIDLTDTSATGLLDNTPTDGVPIIVGGDAQALIDALSVPFSVGYDMNPAHMLREILIARDTNGSGDPAEIGASFTAAADRLFDEGFMLSLYWRKPSDKQAIIREIEQHIDARVYQDRSSGLWEIKLIRDDFDAATLPVFDRTNVIEWGDDIEWPDPSNLPNQVTVVYTDWKNEDEPGSITLTNPARVQAIGKVINRKLDYLGITSPRIAARVAQRELIASSAPLVRGSIVARYAPVSLNLGSPIRINNPRLGIHDIVARITEIEDGDGRQNGVRISFVEDAFTLPETELVVTEEIDRADDREALPMDLRLVEEAPYWQVQAEVGQDTLDAELAADPTLGWLNVTGKQPNGASVNFDCWVDTGAGYVEKADSISFCPVSILRSTLPPRADRTKFLVDVSGLGVVEAGKLIKIGEEYLRIDSVTPSGTWEPGDYWAPDPVPAGEVALIEAGRGCLDTSPQEHLPGAAVFFWQDFAGTDDEAYTAAVTANVKLRTATTVGLLNIDSAPVDVVDFDSRAMRPYPPGRVQIAGSYAAPAAGWAGTLAITWAHRSRLLQTDSTFDDHTVADIGPEPGTTYRVRVWPLDYLGAPYGSPLLDVGAISGTSYNLDTSATPVPAGAWGMRIEVRSERGGYVSTRNRAFDVPVVIEPELLPGGTWLDLNDLGSVWQDVDGTVAVTTDGQPIGLIENQRSTII